MYRRPRDEYTFGLADKLARPLRGSIAAPLAGTRTRPRFDPDAQAYITATGELFPDALNTLVLGIKAAGLWDDHIGSIKKAIGVPSLAASMIDLRNTAFNGTAVNTPTHSATAGWGFTAASSQVINGIWAVPATGSKASQNSVHYGFRVLAHTVGQPGSSWSGGGSDPSVGFVLTSAGVQRFNMNEGLGSRIQTTNANATGHFIGTRTDATAREAYRNGVSIGSDTTASGGPAAYPLVIGARRTGVSSFDNYCTGRISLHHAGAGLDDSQAAALTALFDAYATAAGEA